MCDFILDKIIFLCQNIFINDFNINNFSYFIFVKKFYNINVIFDIMCIINLIIVILFDKDNKFYYNYKM